jgi:diguanylate cyclase (GGDEF)-like protein
VLPETDAAGAFIVAEKVREAVAAYRFNEAEAQAPIYLTVSIGVATFPVHALDRDSMMRAADDALYSAKRAGKDRVRAARLRLSRLTDETEEGTVE